MDWIRDTWPLVVIVIGLWTVPIVVLAVIFAVVAIFMGGIARRVFLILATTLIAAVILAWVIMATV